MIDIWARVRKHSRGRGLPKKPTRTYTETLTKQSLGRSLLE